MQGVKEYLFADSAQDAVALMRRHEGIGRYIAGGTDMYLSPAKCDFVVDVNRAGLGDIARTPNGDLFLGSAATLHNIATNPLVTEYAGGTLSHAAAHCGNRPIRTTATVGGNLCHALPSADMAPVLLVLDATCYIADEDSQESLPLCEFFLGPRQTVLEDRLLVGLALQSPEKPRFTANYKLTRSAEDISLVQVAASLEFDGDTVASARIALGAVAPIPLRARLAEAALEGQSLADLTEDYLTAAAAVAASECAPLDDHRASAEYRRAMVAVFTRRVLLQVVAKANTETGASS
ncbi:MAG: carbon-monoxide dehydrogenase medium subunit [Candidatus Krumholzibacteriia bacterium]|jgi:carbon-monoxide dehydrogenase medium subunit